MDYPPHYELAAKMAAAQAAMSNNSYGQTQAQLRPASPLEAALDAADQVNHRLRGLVDRFTGIESRLNPCPPSPMTGQQGSVDGCGRVGMIGALHDRSDIAHDLLGVLEGVADRLGQL